TMLSPAFRASTNMADSSCEIINSAGNGAHAPGNISLGALDQVQEIKSTANRTSKRGELRPVGMLQRREKGPGEEEAGRHWAGASRCALPRRAGGPGKLHRNHRRPGNPTSPRKFEPSFPCCTMPQRVFPYRGKQFGPAVWEKGWVKANPER